ncbi:MAG: hypothetical protein RIF33_13785 [Cyclobacteriaceae bacterium]
MKNKLSNGLVRLLTQKQVQHFNKIGELNFSDLERDNYFRQFEHAQVAEIAEYGLPRARR